MIHNAEFDVGFLDAELARGGIRAQAIAERCRVLDTLELARRLHPGQRNSLDALCKRYSVDNSNRDLHGALLDARILADVYLAMSGGQAALGLDAAPRRGVAAPGRPRIARRRETPGRACERSGACRARAVTRGDRPRVRAGAPCSAPASARGA